MAGIGSGVVKEMQRDGATEQPSRRAGRAVLPFAAQDLPEERFRYVEARSPFRFRAWGDSRRIALIPGYGVRQPHYTPQSGYIITPTIISTLENVASSFISSRRDHADKLCLAALPLLEVICGEGDEIPVHVTSLCLCLDISRRCTDLLHVCD